MDDTDKFRPMAGAAVGGDDAAAIQSLVATYFLRADLTGEASAADLFIESGSLRLGKLEIEGKRAIADFFAERAQANTDAGRITRHLSGPIALTRLADGRISGRSTAVVYAGAGVLPLPANVPSTICDFEDTFQREDDGSWRFERRAAAVIFTGAGAAGFAK